MGVRPEHGAAHVPGTLGIPVFARASWRAAVEFAVQWQTENTETLPVWECLMRRLANSL